MFILDTFVFEDTVYKQRLILNLNMKFMHSEKKDKIYNSLNMRGVALVFEGGAYSTDDLIQKLMEQKGSHIPGNMVYGFIFQEIWYMDLYSRKYGIWIYIPGNMVYGFIFQEIWYMDLYSRKYGIWIYIPGNMVYGFIFQEIWYMDLYLYCNMYRLETRLGNWDASCATC